MASETVVTVVGNLTTDIDLRSTASGVPVVGFTIASNPRVFDPASGGFRDGDALFLRCTLWRQAAENAAQSLVKGTRVIVTGRLKQRTFEDREGAQRTVVEVDADEVAVSLIHARATVTKTYRPPPAGPAPGSWRRSQPAQESSPRPF